MEQGKKTDTEKRKSDSWVDKAGDWMDETAEKIHESKTYKKADQKLEDVTKNIFRKAGKWWGKSTHHFKDPDKEKDTK